MFTRSLLETLITVAAVFAVFPVENLGAVKPDMALTLNNGYRTDNFNFNIAGDINGQNPNILSELSWKNLRMYQVSGVLALIAPDILYTRTSLGYGWALSGSMQDSDYSGDNRSGEFSRSVNDGDATVLDASFGAGYPFKPPVDGLEVIPLIGYAYDRQQLRVFNGNQVIPPAGPFPNLNSTYHAQWWGPWLGFDLSWLATQRFTFLGSFEYHWADYRAVDNHNLRPDLQHPESFVQTASGGGVSGSLGAEWAFNDTWSAKIKTDFTSWSTRPGISEAFSVNAPVATTRLNEVNWNSWAISLGITRRFKMISFTRH